MVSVLIDDPTLEKIETFNGLLIRDHRNHVFTAELTARRQGGERCHGRDICGCKGLHLDYEMFAELHHDGKDGRERKRETTHPNGKVKHPVDYNDDDMEKQRDVLLYVCRYWHRLVDLNQRKSKKSLKQVYMERATRRIILSRQGDKSAFRDHHVDDGNFPAHDNHHLTGSFNLKIGNVIFETRKFSMISTVYRERFSSCGDFIENLFPEIILTRLVDSRIHKLVHLMLNRLAVCKELFGVEFPYRYDAEKSLLIYVGELSEDDEKWLRDIAVDNDGIVKLPSATGVLEIGTDGTSRRSLEGSDLGDDVLGSEDEDSD